MTSRYSCLSRNARFALSGGSLRISCYDSRIIHVSDPVLGESVVKLAAFLREPREDSQVEEFFSKERLPNGAAALAILRGAGVVRERPVDITNRFSRQWVYYELCNADHREVQQRLAAAHLLLIGCGGIGSALALQLATAGVGRLTLCDFDCVELSNLNRQFAYTEADVGKQKARCLADAVQSRIGSVEVTTCMAPRAPEDFDTHLPSDADIALVVGDSQDLPFLVNDWSLRTGVPTLGGGYHGTDAVWGPLFIPGKSACFRCMFPTTETDKEWRGVKEDLSILSDYFKAPSTGPINLLVASGMGFDTIRFLGKFGSPLSMGARVIIGTQDFSRTIVEVTRDPGCICASFRSKPLYGT